MLYAVPLSEFQPKKDPTVVPILRDPPHPFPSILAGSFIPDGLKNTFGVYAVKWGINSFPPLSQRAGVCLLGGGEKALQSVEKKACKQNKKAPPSSSLISKAIPGPPPSP